MKIFKNKYRFSLKDYRNFDVEDRKVFLLQNEDCNSLLNDFYSKVLKVIDKKIHFPIIRLADGEFQFLLGTNELNFRKPFVKLIYHMLKQYYEKFFSKNFEAKSRTYTSGRYNINEIKPAIIHKYSIALKQISRKGIIAIYTIIKPGFYSEQYLPKLESFLLKNNINLSETNYIPFYFVYILLTNKRFRKFYTGKNIHLITSYNDERKIKIEKSLKSYKVGDISWTKISPDNSLNDKIDKNKINNNTDIIFVGGGLGKVNIFNQLNNFPCLIIDAGYIFETWQNPKLVVERDYCKTHD